MDGKITGETDDLLGLSVIDNNDVEHIIDIRKYDGDVIAHNQDGYPDDPNERTDEENAHVKQARRYAKYYVATETDHETLPWDLNPDRIETVFEAVGRLSDEEITEHFGELLEQCLSHYQDDPDVDVGDVSRPVSLPTDNIASDDAVTYQQEIYLDEDDEIETTAGISICYYVAKGDRRTTRHGTAPDREPDGRIEISPVPIVAAAPFRDYLRYNLRCQIRDCYLGMGLEPPETYKVLGPGQYQFTVRYYHSDMYPEYFDKQADIPGYRYDFTPSAPVPEDKLAAGMASWTPTESLYSHVRELLFSRS